LTTCAYYTKEYHSQQGEWLAPFDKPLPDQVTADQLKKNNSELTIDDVIAWKKNGGNLRGRLIWWETFARHTDLYKQIAKPLMSVGTVGSMDVERSAKGLKHEILCPKRNELSTDQAVTLFGMSENLRHLINARKDVTDKIHDSVGGGIHA
jgi:hypothetical protein